MTKPRWLFNLFSSVRLDARCPHVHLSTQGSEPGMEPALVTITCRRCGRSATLDYDEFNGLGLGNPLFWGRSISKLLDAQEN